MNRSIAEKIYPTAQALVDAVQSGTFASPLVVTNGCFDILHAGHVHYLEQARAKGNCLLVLMNADVSVQRLKGPQRPIVNEVGRMSLLAALQSVDAVAPFDEETPEHWIDTIKPDILVKGGDWSVEQIAGANGVLARGGRVETIEFVHDTSTTNIVNKIRDLG